MVKVRASIKSVITVEQIREAIEQKARQLPLEVKKRFWEAFLQGNNVGRCREIAGIDDLLVAARLVPMLHKTVTINGEKLSIPMTVEEIT